ncbi:helix-turn-helix domain-containing protein [Paenibacillus koleovorans]|uniref:helix-turn-helix domain-containing protein n=1 Tax=Paenibacillus koleovorans TaxID=121608 RepID=UPI0013E2931F|nr:helix-turn-helix domain-containing protein [Paenibacillus koleovorans]
MAENHNNPAEQVEETGAPPPGVLLANHFVEPFGYRTNRRAGTRDYLLTLTLGGDGEYRLGNRTVGCRRGDAFILVPGTPHHYRTKENGQPWDFVWCHFLPAAQWESYLQLPEAMPGLLHVHVGNEALLGRLQIAFRRLTRDHLHMDRLYERLAYNALEEILLLLQVQAQPQRTGDARDPRVEEVLRLLTLQMKEPHTIAALAERVNLSPSRLAHLFKQETGASVIEMLLRLRLRHAARQLEYTSRSIAEVADDVGFQSPYYFTKQFGAAYGVSPSAYRKQAQAAHANAAHAIAAHEKADLSNTSFS